MTMLRLAGAPRRLIRLAAFALAASGAPAFADEIWTGSWGAAQQGPWATPAAISTVIAPGEFQANEYFTQPDAVIEALPDSVAKDQSFRMVLRPDLWGDTFRFRFSNVFGSGSITLGAASVGLQEYSANLVAGTSTTITFGGKPGVRIAAGERVFSDPVKLSFVSDATASLLAGRNLAVSFAISGEAAALSHHGSAYTTSFIGAPGSGDHTADVSGAAFPYTTASWFLLDGADVMTEASVPVVVTVGDSITDGTLGTNNINDRWPDVLSYRLHAALGDKVSVVNEAINANALAVDMVGPAGVKRLERDVLGVSGVKTVVLLEGINDIGAMGVAPDALIQGYKDFAAALHKAGIRVVAGTLTPALYPGDYALSALGSQYGAAYGSPATDAARRTVNDFIRSTDIFDAVIDFEAAIIDPTTGAMQDQFAPNSMGGPGDYLHPNHAGYLAMGEAIDLTAVLPPA
ncbi:MAG TPA: GDSL-type esterase/lipase family protein [Devosia sp.]|nr:GDSL-type esterase/lipase family protein [Devosia sp.]